MLNHKLWFFITRTKILTDCREIPSPPTRVNETGIHLLIYLGMGWIGAVDFASLKAAISEPGLYWMTAGGLSYTVGVVFYLLDNAKKLDHAHGIWHFFVLAGTICHFVSIIMYVR